MSSFRNISKSQVHELLESMQKEQNIPIRPLKRVNTVRWSSQVICLALVPERYSIIMTLEEVSSNSSFDASKRSKASELMSYLETKFSVLRKGR